MGISAVRPYQSEGDGARLRVEGGADVKTRIGGLPGERIDGLPVNVTIHPGCLLIDHLHLEVLRRPVESAH